MIVDLSAFKEFKHNVLSNSCIIMASQPVDLRLATTVAPTVASERPDHLRIKVTVRATNPSRGSVPLHTFEGNT